MSLFIISIRAMSKAVCKSFSCKVVVYQMNFKPYRLYHSILNSNQFLENQLTIGRHYLNHWSSTIYSQGQNSCLRTCLLNVKGCYSKDSKSSVNKNSENKEKDTMKPKKPKKELKTYITLLGVDNSICVSTVEEAKKIAERRGLKLVKVVDFDPKSSRAVYKLVTESQYLKDDWGDPQNKKEKSNNDEKFVSLSSNTNKNDVMTKINMMKKWLSKQLEIRVVITGDARSGENIYKMIEKELGSDVIISQKRVKSSTIRFQINSPKKSKDIDVEKNNT